MNFFETNSKDQPTDADIDIISKITHKKRKSPNDIELLRKTLSQFRFINKLLEDVSEEHQTKFFQDIKYQYNSAYETIISHGDLKYKIILIQQYISLIKGNCLVYLYILIKGKAIKLIDPPSHVLYQKKRHQDDKLLNLFRDFEPKNNSKLDKCSFNEKNEQIRLLKEITEEYIKENQLNTTHTNLEQTEVKIEYNSNQLEQLFQDRIGMKNIHPGLRKDPLIHKLLYHKWRSENIIIDEEDDENSLESKKNQNYKGEYEELYHDKKYKMLEIDGKRIFMPYDQSDDYLALFNYVYPEMLISHILIPGDYFGAHSFIIENENKKGIIAIEDSHLLLVHYGSYRKIFRIFISVIDYEYFEKTFSQRIKILDQVALFNDQSYFKTYLLSRDWGVRRYPIHAHIYKEGDFVDKAYIILSGQIEITHIAEKNNQTHDSLEQGSRVKNNLKNLNCIWSKHHEKSVKHKVKQTMPQCLAKLACLEPYQMFGDSEIIGPSVSAFRASTATVLSEFAEVYEIQGEVLMSLFSKREVKQKKVEGRLKEDWRSKLELKSIHTQQQLGKQLNEIQFKSCGHLFNQNKLTETDISKYDQIKEDLFDIGLKKRSKQILRSKNLKRAFNTNMEFLEKFDKLLGGQQTFDKKSIQHNLYLKIIEEKSNCLKVECKPKNIIDTKRINNNFLNDLSSKDSNRNSRKFSENSQKSLLVKKNECIIKTEMDKNEDQFINLPKSKFMINSIDFNNFVTDTALSSTTYESSLPMYYSMDFHQIKKYNDISGSNFLPSSGKYNSISPITDNNQILKKNEINSLVLTEKLQNNFKQKTFTQCRTPRSNESEEFISELKIKLSEYNKNKFESKDDNHIFTRDLLLKKLIDIKNKQDKSIDIGNHVEVSPKSKTKFPQIGSKILNTNESPKLYKDFQLVFKK